jgi:hypothetical protein
MKNKGFAYVFATTIVTTLGILILLLTLLTRRFVWLAIQDSVSWLFRDPEISTP